MSVRTFTCIAIEDDMKEELRAWQDELKEKYGGDFRWVDPESMHITLKFLGDVGEDRLEDIAGSLRAAVRDSSAFDFELASAGAFPRPERPRVLWAGVGRGHRRLCALQEAVENTLERAEGFAPERRKYHPHVTLARARGRGAGPSMGDELAAVADRIWGRGRVEAVIFMRSDLRPGGPVYTSLEEIPLD